MFSLELCVTIWIHRQDVPEGDEGAAHTDDDAEPHFSAAEEDCNVCRSLSGHCSDHTGTPLLPCSSHLKLFNPPTPGPSRRKQCNACDRFAPLNHQISLM